MAGAVKQITVVPLRPMRLSPSVFFFIKTLWEFLDWLKLGMSIVLGYPSRILVVFSKAIVEYSLKRTLDNPS